MSKELEDEIRFAIPTKNDYDGDIQEYALIDKAVLKILNLLNEHVQNEMLAKDERIKELESNLFQFKQK